MARFSTKDNARHWLPTCWKGMGAHQHRHWASLWCPRASADLKPRQKQKLAQCWWETQAPKPNVEQKAGGLSSLEVQRKQAVGEGLRRATEPDEVACDSSVTGRRLGKSLCLSVPLPLHAPQRRAVGMPTLRVPPLPVPQFPLLPSGNPQSFPSELGSLYQAGSAFPGSFLRPDLPWRFRT